ncbi:hypothetical protein [Alkanindiges illinoisensis]|uniref:hypothetical protein n=1 Tax=Alkanindiges illinoisensis TaxID=197183 RepID=UPI00047BCD98|nr:hypothetical protein [Alkanindiges illinoisensis]
MNVFKKLVQLSLINTLALLSACGGGSDGSDQYLPAGKKLTTVQQFNTSDGNRLEQTAEYQLSYTNGRLNRINVFDSSGTDNTWGTSDDNLYSYITCEFSGHLNQPLRDPALEFYMPNPMQSSVTGSILITSLGIKPYGRSLCSLGYNADISFKEQEFIPKLDNADKPFFIREWQADQIQGQIVKTQNITYGPVSKQNIIDNEDCSSSVCDQAFLGFQNGRNQYQYLDENYLADIKDKKLYEYTQQDGQLKTVNIYQYGATPEKAMENVGALEKLGSLTYEYEKNQVNICTKNSEGLVESFSINIYEDKKIKQIDEYASVSCAAEDVVQKRLIYNYQ